MPRPGRRGESDLFTETTISYDEPTERRVSQFGIFYPTAAEPTGYTVLLILRDGSEHRIEVPDLERLQPLVYLLRSFEEVEFDPATKTLACGPEKPGEASRQRPT